MNKDFKIWHEQKSDLHENKIRAFFHEREVWFAALGANIGFEQNGKGSEFRRPIVIIAKFNNESFWGIPLTTKTKKGRYYYTFTLEGRGSNTAILSQLKLMDAKRLQYKIGTVESNEFEAIKQKLKKLLS